MVVEELLDVSDSRLRPYRDLTNHELRSRREGGLFIAETDKVVTVALESGVELRSLLVEDRKLDRLAQWEGLVSDEVPVYTAPREVLSAIVGYPIHRGVLAAMRRPDPIPLAALASAGAPLVMLDGLTDTTNVGALVRDAAALGAGGLVFSPTCADPLSRRAVRVSMGTLFRLPWTRPDSGEWPEKAFAVLKEAGYTVVACALTEDALTLGSPELDALLGRAHNKTALVLGPEGEGLSQTVLSCCDAAAVIPMANGVDSLNVAAAGAVFCYELIARPSG